MADERYRCEAMTKAGMRCRRNSYEVEVTCVTRNGTNGNCTRRGVVLCREHLLRIKYDVPLRGIQLHDGHHAAAVKQ